MHACSWLAGLDCIHQRYAFKPGWSTPAADPDRRWCSKFDKSHFDDHRRRQSLERNWPKCFGTDSTSGVPGHLWPTGANPDPTQWPQRADHCHLHPHPASFQHTWERSSKQCPVHWICLVACEMLLPTFGQSILPVDSGKAGGPTWQRKCRAQASHHLKCRLN